MQAMQQSPGIPEGSFRSFNQTVKYDKLNCLPYFQNPEDGSSRMGFGQDPYFTFESSTISCTGSPVSQLGPESSSSNFPTDPHVIASTSPIDGSSRRHNSVDLKHKLIELETAMMAPDSNNFDICDTSSQGESDHTPSDSEHWKQLSEMISKGNLKQVLVECAKAVSVDDLFTSEWLISELRHMVSVSGEPIQRLGAYMLEGLVARLTSSGSSIYKALKCKESTNGELLSYMHLFYEICPIFKFGYMSANGAIAEAMKNESKIHIIDFQIAQGSQWVSLLQALAARPDGIPHVRITGIDDYASEYARGGGLDIVGKRLSVLAETCNLPFEFHGATLCGSEVMLQNVILHPEETLAVNFPYMLHHVPDESVGLENHRDSLLRLVHSWSPKVVTLVEQESNTNTTPFLSRFIETLEYYSAIFESINVALPRDHKDRINVEQHCLARDIVNIIACEGAERVERHEVLGKWRSRFLMAGFRPYPLSPLVNVTIKALVQKYNRSYRLEERDQALYLGWMNRVLVSSCAWQ